MNQWLRNSAGAWVRGSMLPVERIAPCASVAHELFTTECHRRSEGPYIRHSIWSHTTSTMRDGDVVVARGVCSLSGCRRQPAPPVGTRRRLRAVCSPFLVTKAIGTGYPQVCLVRVPKMRHARFLKACHITA